MSYAGQSNSLIMQHAEDSFISQDGLINEGEISTRLGLKGIPYLAEKIIVERDLSFLEEYFCRYHISQISSKKTISVIKKAKNEQKTFSTGVSINNTVELKDVAQNVGRLRLIVSNVLILLQRSCIFDSKHIHF